ncbi:hypothetical protein ABT234_24745 [Streptomyces sp. NPDC001586]
MTPPPTGPRWLGSHRADLDLLIRLASDGRHAPQPVDAERL